MRAKPLDGFENLTKIIATVERAETDDLQELMRLTGLEPCDLRGANLDESVLDGADFSWLDLRGLSLANASIRDTAFRYSNLANTSLSGATCINADFSHCYMVGADLRGADLKGANFEYADLRHTCIIDADLTGAHLEGSIGIPTAEAHIGTTPPASAEDEDAFLRDLADRMGPIYLVEEKEADVQTDIKDLLSLAVDTLNLSARSENSLKTANIRMLRDLIAPEETRKVPISKRTLVEMRDELTELGLRLSFEPPAERSTER